jgi:hypothetical protein
LTHKPPQANDAKSYDTPSHTREAMIALAA